MSLTVSIADARPLVITCIQADIVPYVISSPGMGKSAMMHSIAKEYNLELLDERISTYVPEDASGLPMFNEDKTKAKFIPMENFPLEGDPLPKGKEGWLLFLDELPSGSRGVLAALYKLILDRKVGNNKLHSKVIIVAAGNKKTDKAIVNDIGTALQSRMCTIEIHSNAKEFISYTHSANFHHSISAFIAYRPELVNVFKPDHVDHTFACERTWEFASKLSKTIEKSGVPVDYQHLPLFTGVLGEGVGKEYFAFCRIYKELPSIEDIMNKPAYTDVPNSVASQWAICGAVADHMDKSNAVNAMEYLMRLPTQFSFFALQGLFKRKPDCLSWPPVAKWLSINAEKL